MKNPRCLSRVFETKSRNPLIPRVSVALVVFTFAARNTALSQSDGEYFSSAETAVRARIVDNTDGAVDENPRQRRRVLDKRNPLATEYSSVGDVGAVILSDTDSEGVNSRARIPGGSPFEGPEQEVSGQISYNYSDLSGNGKFQGKGAYKRVLGEKRRWAVSISGERTGVDHTFEGLRNRWRTRDFEGRTDFFLDRFRLSRNEIRTVLDRTVFVVDRQLNERHDLYVRTLIEEREDHETDHRVRYAIGEGEVESLNSNSGTVHGAAMERSVRDTSEHRRVIRLLAGGDYSGDRSRFDYSFYASRWEREESGRLNPIFRTEGVGYTYSLADPAFPAVSALDGRNLNDPAEFTFLEYTLRKFLTVDEDRELQINYDQNVEFGAISGVIRTGAVYRSKERSNRYEQSVYDGYDAKNGGALTLERLANSGQGTVVRDHYLMGPEIELDAFRKLIAAEPDGFYFNAARTRLESDANNYRAREEVTGGYILNTLKGERWELNAGLRFEKTQWATNGNTVLTDEDGEYLATESVSGESSYKRWFPSVSLDYELNDGVRVKAAWFKTLARPDYFDLVPFRRIYTNFQFIWEGNPDIQPTQFDNLVLGVHVESEIVGELNVAAYFKRLETFFYETDELIEGGPFDGWERRRQQNGNSASVRGFEFGWKRKLESAPARVGSLTVSVFYTFSEFAAHADLRPDETLRLPERSRHFAAVTAEHELGPLESVFSLTYRSRFLDKIGTDVQRDEIIEEALSMNVAFNLRHSNKLRSFVEFSNFIDWPEREFEGDATRVSSNEYGSWKLEAGLRFEL